MLTLLIPMLNKNVLENFNHRFSFFVKITKDLFNLFVWFNDYWIRWRDDFPTRECLVWQVSDRIEELGFEEALVYLFFLPNLFLGDPAVNNRYR